MAFECFHFLLLFSYYTAIEKVFCAFLFLCVCAFLFIHVKVLQWGKFLEMCYLDRGVYAFKLFVYNGVCIYSFDK